MVRLLAVVRTTPSLCSWCSASPRNRRYTTFSEFSRLPTHMILDDLEAKTQREMKAKDEYETFELGALKLVRRIIFVCS